MSRLSIRTHKGIAAAQRFTNILGCEFVVEAVKYGQTIAHCTLTRVAPGTPLPDDMSPGMNVAPYALGDVFVEPEYRRTGLGSRIVRRALDFADKTPVILYARPYGHGKRPTIDELRDFYGALGFYEYATKQPETYLYWEK